MLLTNLLVQPDFKAIKKRIEDLITRDYLERDKDNPNMFRYLAWFDPLIYNRAVTWDITKHRGTREMYRVDILLRNYMVPINLLPLWGILGSEK